MFSKQRRRAASNSSQRALPAPNASASVAATKAFIHDRETNTNLPHAAAAQALRTHTPTPISVGDTITKRMIRRGSVSSNGSSARPPSSVHLRRPTSPVSMMERSFRAASPARSSQVELNAPPVPPMPMNIPENSVAHRRTSSLEPGFRVASPSSRRARQVACSDGGVHTMSQPQRPASPDVGHNSVNFSRPISPGLSGSMYSASAQHAASWHVAPVLNPNAVQPTDTTPQQRPKSSSGVSAYEMRNTQRVIQHAADSSVRTRHIAHNVEHSSLSKGSMRVAKPSGTALQPRSFLTQTLRQPPRAVNPNSPDAVYDPSSRTFIHKQDAMARHRELTEQLEEPPQKYVAQHLDNYQYHNPPREVIAQRSRAPARQIVREELPPVTSKSFIEPRSTATEDAAFVVPKPRGEPSPEQRRPAGSEEPAVQSLAQANSSRRLDSTQNETKIGLSPIFSSSIDMPNHEKLTKQTPAPVIPTTTNMVVHQNRSSFRVEPERIAPLSTPRNAHFAPQAMELTGEKHQPPPRSISPAKSALKSSPSASRRGSNSTTLNARLLVRTAPSEASDTTSDNESKKRRMRVSFDEKPSIAGMAARPDMEVPRSPTGLSASKWSPIAEKENEFEDLMKPRAALPVFGSLRQKEKRTAPEEHVRGAVTGSSIKREVYHSSSDHALGSLVVGDLVSKQRAADDSDSSDEAGVQKYESTVPEPKSLTASLDDKSPSPSKTPEQVVELPAIALLPATPSPYEKPQPIYHPLFVPGGWDVEAKQQEAAIVEPNAVQLVTSSLTQAKSLPAQQPVVPAQDEESSDDNDSVYSDAYEDMTDAEGGFGSIDAMVGSSSSSTPSGLLSSKYVDSSAASGPVSNNGRDENPASSTRRSGTERQSHAQEVAARVLQASTIRTTLQGSHIDRQNQSGEMLASSSSSPVPAKPLKSVLKKMSVPAYQTNETPFSKTMHGPPSPRTRAEPTMRSNDRRGSDSVSQPPTQIRKSMRGGETRSPANRNSMPATSQIRQSMRGLDVPPAVSSGLAASRHSMIQTNASKPARTAMRKRQSQAAPVSKTGSMSMPVPQFAAAPVPVPTYDSDSDVSVSSFQRERSRKTCNQGGRYTMRGSMRNESAPTTRSPASAPKSVRAISPPRSPAPANRKSMRPNSPTPEGGKRSKFRLRSLSPIGRFRSTKDQDMRPPSPDQNKKLTIPKFGNQSKSTASAAMAPFKSSRFADSSDEEDNVHSRSFQSRFADSDSDDAEAYTLPADLAPVRGIPRLAGEEDGDSTDLEEEADEKKPAAHAGEAKNSAANGNANGNADGTTNGKATMPTGGLHDSKYASLPRFEAGGKTKTKRGFFGLGKQKTVFEKTSPMPSGFASVSTPAPTLATAEEADFPMPGVQRLGQSGLLTPIDEDKDMDTAYSNLPPQTKKSPKLQRRSTPDWPLPAMPGMPVGQRPQSSDGVAQQRPRLHPRQSSMTSNSTAPVGGSPGRSVSFGQAKKKKFPGLRRVFGISN